MALLLHDEGTRALTARLEVDLRAPAPVGTYVEISARVVERSGRRLVLDATATGEGGVIATALGTFAPI
jgi:acyl-coenzyme A thioesterase PaaI-like protein